MLCGLILAGGMGKCLWPLSTEERPKQFVEMIDGKSLLQNTVNTMLQFMPMHNVFICTTEDYEAIVRKQLPELPSKNIIVEPERRDLATAIMLGTLMVKRYFKNPDILITPCNYVVENKAEFKRVINSYIDGLKVMKGEVITFGINKWDLRENDIYFTTNNVNMQFNSNSFYRVMDVAVDLNKEAFDKLKDNGDAVIGTCIYLGEAKAIIDKLRKYNRETYEILKKIEVCKEESIKKTLIRHYFKTTSNDLALRYGMKGIAIVPIDVGFKRIITWDDVKNTSLIDRNGNLLLGKINETEGKNNVVITNSIKVMLKNINDLFVIEEDGKIIISKNEELLTGEGLGCC